MGCLSRIKVEQQGIYRQERFAFLTIVEGEGRVNEVSVSKGETILVPDGIEHLELTGTFDMFVASYKNKEV